MRLKECVLCSVDRCNVDQWCYGCEEYICDECSVDDNVMGKHHPEDHLYGDNIEYTDEDGEYE